MTISDIRLIPVILLFCDTLKNMYTQQHSLYRHIMSLYLFIHSFIHSVINYSYIIFLFHDCTISHAVMHQPCTTEAQLKIQGSPCSICDAKSGTEAGSFLLVLWILPARHHATNVLCDTPNQSLLTWHLARFRIIKIYLLSLFCFETFNRWL